jgi:hypothetical protein
LIIGKGAGKVSIADYSNEQLVAQESDQGVG